ncbi:MAG: glycosyltransferase [Phycisphaerales bacterium]|nr:glycosyltransferase [Phycisphaerales bacterium]
MIAFVLPTRNRPERLAGTLEALGALTVPGGGEVLIADNASEQALRVPPLLANGLRTRVVRLEHNAGAAARNAAARAASPNSRWLIMLDDDSHPVEAAEPFAVTINRLASLPPDVAAVSADILLPRHNARESGGLPEVFVGCGVAIRRAAFDAVGGYDPSFGYYVEEYDLAARLLLSGHRVAFDPSFVVHHHKVETGRDMELILERLTRNNAWVMQRYAPEGDRRRMLREQRRRYRAVAEKERALGGYMRGLALARRTLQAQPRRPMPREIWDRFTGLAHARAALGAAHRERPFRSAAIIEPGKNCWAVEQALSEVGECSGVEWTTADRAEVLVIGSLSPGPMLDALARWGGRRVVAPWLAVCGARTGRIAA